MISLQQFVERSARRSAEKAVSIECDVCDRLHNNIYMCRDCWLDTGCSDQMVKRMKLLGHEGVYNKIYQHLMRPLTEAIEEEFLKK